MNKEKQENNVEREKCLNLATLLTDLFQTRNPEWIKEVSQQGFQDLPREYDFVKQEDKWYCVMYFRGSDCNVSGFKLNYTDPRDKQKFQYLGGMEKFREGMEPRVGNPPMPREIFA